MALSGEMELAKLYMKIDGDDEDALIELLYDAATEYLDNAGIPSDASPRLFDLARCGLMLFWHDHPEELGKDENLPAGTRVIVNQLKPVTF